MAEKSKILIIGGTGYIGKFILEASAKAGHPTVALVRESTLSSPDKAHLINNFRNLGVHFLIVRIQVLFFFPKIVENFKDVIENVETRKGFC